MVNIYKYLSFSGYFILNLFLTVTLSFGLSFLIVPHHPIDPYQLMEEMTISAEKVTSDWWDDVYMSEKHHERFSVLGEKRENVFKMLFVMLLPLIFWGCWLVFIRQRRLDCNTTPAQHST